MSTTKKLEAGSMLAVAGLVLILIAVGFFRSSASDRANDAWAARLTEQADQLQEEALVARAANAWSQRLSGLAEINFPGIDTFERGAVGMSDRAIDAYADRLTGLAEYYAAQK
jgi:hypothetical protein